MLFNGAINLTNSVYQKLITESENTRRSLLAKFRYFYVKDFDEMEKVVKNELTDKKIFSQATLDKVPFRYLDVTQKALSRLTSGIYDEDPVITINGKQDDKLAKALVKSKYLMKTKEALRKGVFVNTVVAHPVKRDKVEIDILMPDEITVKTGYDYMKFEEIAITRYDPVAQEIFNVVWTADKHYRVSSVGNSSSITGNESQVNPYHSEVANPLDALPFAIFRVSEGIDFYGEPNWDLYDNQKSICIKVMQMDYSLMFNTFPIWIATNLGLSDNEVLSPAKIINRDKLSEQDMPPDLQPISPDFDYSGLREDVDWRIRSTLSSVGLPAASASIEELAQSGVAKQIDEVELAEIRKTLKNVCYYFNIDLLNKWRMVWNYYAAEMNEERIPDGEFEIEFSEEKPSESVADKKERREMEIQYNLSNPVKFLMEDKEVDEAEATKQITSNKEINSQNKQSPDSDEGDLNVG